MKKSKAYLYRSVSDLTARGDILEALKSRRGISFSKLKDKTGIANGTIQYHVNTHPEIGKKNGAIIHRQRCSNCPLENFCSDKCVKMLLEHPLRRKILLKKLEGMQNNDIASELDVHRSTVSYHLSKLPAISEAFQKLWKRSFRK